MTVLRYGEASGRAATQRVAAPVSSIAVLRTINASDCANGQTVFSMADGKEWQFSNTSVLADDGQLVIAPASGTGRWLLIPGLWTLALPITFATADAAVLYTVPAGAVIQPVEFDWLVSTGFTGGASSAIGVSSGTKSGYTTKGDLLGGAAGDVAATLVVATTPNLGTIGAGFDTLAKRRKVLTATDSLRFDRITSAFTAGAGNVNLTAFVRANAGA